MMTPAYLLTATERVLPKLALDFTTAALDARITFTRTTGASNPATYVNSSGYIASATNNQPRFDYDPVTLACKGLLIEESRANRMLYSQDFSQAAVWVPKDMGVATDGTLSPDNTSAGYKLTPNTTNTDHNVQQGVAGVTAAASYTVSVFAKAGGYSVLQLFWTSTHVSGSPRANFNLANGTLGSISAGVTATITPYKDGWYRCTATVTTALTSLTTYFAAQTSTTATRNVAFVGDGTSGVYIWGAQLEAGAFATSYIPTTTAALTRNADVATMTGTNFSDWWTATTGASTVWLAPRSTSTLAYLSFDDNTANNSIVLANSTTSGQSKITSGGSLQATLTAGTITANATNKVGCSWNTNDCAATANAASSATTASATIPTVTQLRIGSNGTAYANAWIQKIMYWPQRVTNNEIQAFTK